MFIQLMPADAIDFLYIVFNILGSVNIVLNFCGLLSVAKLTSRKFSYFTPQGVILMAASVALNVVMIILKPIEVIIYGRLYTFYLSEFLPDFPAFYYFILECLQVQLVYFGIYVYIVMIVRYHKQAFSARKNPKFRQHLVTNALIGAAATEGVYLLIKAVRIYFAGNSSDKLSRGAMEGYLRRDYSVYALEELKFCQYFLIVETAIHAILVIATFVFSYYLYYFLKVATPDSVLSRKMFFNTRLRHNIRTSVIIINGSISFPFIARNIYYLSNPNLSSVFPLPYFIMSMVSTTSVPSIFLLSFYYTAIGDRLTRKRVTNAPAVKHGPRQAWPTHVTREDSE